MRALLVFLCLTVVANGLWFRKKSYPVRGYGVIKCGGEAIPRVKVDLMQKRFGFDKRLGTTKTSDRGYFAVSGTARGSSKPKGIYIRVTYQYDGGYGNMRVVSWFSRVRTEESTSRPYSSSINFVINFTSRHCNAYVYFLRALRDYSKRSTYKLPYRVLSIHTDAPIHGGTPYSTTDVIRIPKSYSLTLTTAKHEFAHTLRHSLDGSIAHFLYDVARFIYTRNHYCSKKTNLGFAFNEGWAEFWAGECSFGPYGGNAKDYNYEGNVANALRKLKSNCSSSDSDMVQVLRKNKGRIHSFTEFNDKHGNLFRCKLV